VKLKIKSNLTKGSKKIKIEIKKLIKGCNWKKKNQFNKRNKKIIKRMEIKLKKITYPRLGFNDKTKNKSKFYKKIKNKN